MDKKEVTAEEIQALLDEGKSKTEIGEQFGITATKVGQILAAANKVNDGEGGEPKPKTTGKVEAPKEIPAGVFALTYAETEVNDNSKVVIMTAGEYKKYSEANGRHWGRKAGKKTQCTIEELRALINSKWTPKMIIDKHGMSDEEFKQLVWQLSKRELRDRPLRFDIEADFIERG